VSIPKARYLSTDKRIAAAMFIARPKPSRADDGRRKTAGARFGHRLNIKTTYQGATTLRFLIFGVDQALCERGSHARRS
jgi:hypothetical protein